MPREGKEEKASKKNLSTRLDNDDDDNDNDDEINLQIRKVVNSKHRNKKDSLISEVANGNNKNKKKRKIVEIVNKTEISKKRSRKGNLTKESEEGNGDESSRKLKRRRRNKPNKQNKKKKKNNVELDEASRLQRRTRYLLVKVRMEQNLIDAYSTEGWKGQSREKIRPEKELQRAKKQILNCKLGIREAIHQLDLLSSNGQINDSAVDPDGSVHHENIICAKCKAHEALPDNDIILCDGTCNCAFHQKCLDPPLPTENIPQGDESWFCKFCKTKLEILEATNAHLGTHFPMNSNWEDIFKEEAALPDDGNFVLCPEEEWPSDDSADDDYDPERILSSCNGSISRSEGDDASDCSSSFLGSLEDEPLISCEGVSPLELNGVDSDEISSGEVVCRPRQRATVDYIKLYDEMFGKNAATENEQISEDEDWGPTRRKRKGKETDAAASTLINLVAPENKKSKETPSEAKEKIGADKKMKRSIFRLPHNAVEKLKHVFAENELPERALRVTLSKQLGLEFEKVNKWFKNARYLALKSRKLKGAHASDDVSPGIQKESISETASGEHGDPPSPKDNATSLPLESSKKSGKRRNAHSLANSCKTKHQTKPLVVTGDSSKMAVDIGDNVSLKHLRKKAKEAKKNLNDKNGDRMTEAECEMERLCGIKSRVEKLQQILLRYSNRKNGKGKAINRTDSSVVYVPVVAEVRERS